MAYRIITHAGCMDGYSSAWIVKKFFKQLTKLDLSSEEIKAIDVIGIYPGDIQTESFPFSKDDVVVDLPMPLTDVLFWADHHLTSKPIEEKKNHHWKQTPSCTGFLVELAEEKGAEINQELKNFITEINKIDSADYTLEELKQCYYLQDSYDNMTGLQKVIMVKTMVHTNDNYLNAQVLKTLLSINLGETPVDGEDLNNLNPMMYYRAQLEGHAVWRMEVDKYMYLDEEHDCVVQDDRKVRFLRGVFDRFYPYVKFPESTYHVNIKPMERDSAKISISCNIFHKYWCLLDIGHLCYVVGKKFGEGSGGGHYTVGGTIIKLENADKALKFILDKFKEAEDEASID